jgi:hypothetical protein
MAAAKQKEVTTRQICSIQFGMYTDEEVSTSTPAAAWQQSRGGYRGLLLAALLHSLVSDPAAAQRDH